MTTDPDKIIEEEIPEQTTKETIKQSLEWVVDMMNSGKADPKQVYPRGHYHGD